MLSEHFYTYWKGLFDGGLGDGETEWSREEVAKVFAGLHRLESDEEKIAFLNENDDIDRSLAACRARRGELSEVARVACELSDFHYDQEGHSLVVGFLLDPENRSNQFWVASRLEVTHESWNRVAGSLICCEFDMVCTLSYGGMMRETHLILPYLRTLNMMGVITSEACPGYNDETGPSCQFVLTDDQKNALATIPYLRFRLSNRFANYVGKGRARDPSKVDWFVDVETNEHFRYGVDRFWEDIIETLRSVTPDGG